MADLDTPSKRGSSVGILLFSILAPPFPPDGAIDQGDRQDIAVSYSGILAGVPASTPITVVLRHEVLRAETILGERLSIPAPSPERLIVPIQTPEVLKC